MKIYFDQFEQRYVTENDLNLYAPPERYYKIICGEDDGHYVETWLMEDMSEQEVLYIKGELEREDYVEYINDIRKQCFADNKPIFITSWEVPKNVYEDIIKAIEER